jgi:leader peptidase (prepilin peptidase)/N-methyltransferase
MMTMSSVFLVAALGIVAVGIFGLLIGSFLNVVAYRVPAGRSIVSPPSACPNCGTEIKAYDNVPVISWLLLRGKCRSCNVPISVRYPLVELATGVFFALVAWWSWSGASLSTTPQIVTALLELVAFLYLAAISVALALIDLDTHRLPNAIVLPSYAVGILLLGAAGILGNDLGALASAGTGMAALFAFYLVAALVYPGGMGFGDVKLAGVVGLFLGYLGWGPLLVGAFSAFLLGGLYALVLTLLHRAGRKSGIPFGPWMLAGAWVGIFFGEAIWSGYLSLFGLA